MKKVAGLWIDHRKAVIVIVTDEKEEIRLIISKIEKQLGRSGGIRSTTPFESQQVPADDSRERKFTGLLKIYYDAVIACIHDTDAILIFGPGVAKGELKGHLEKHHLGERIVAIETVDKMTDRQIAAKVRQRFLT